MADIKVFKEDDTWRVRNLSRPSSEAKIEMYDEYRNKRVYWAKGFDLEVFSHGDNRWYSGKILEKKQDDDEKSSVQVCYKNKTQTKWVKLYSSDLRIGLGKRDDEENADFNAIWDEAKKMLNDCSQADGEPPANVNRFDVFISYRYSDGTDASAILNDLLKVSNMKTWFDLEHSDRSPSTLLNAIEASRCFLIFLTRGYFYSKNTMFELQAAQLKEKPIIIVYEYDKEHVGFPDIALHEKVIPGKFKGTDDFRKLCGKKWIRYQRDYLYKNQW